MKEKHDKELDLNPHTEANIDEDGDHIFNYSRNALTLALLCMDFADATKYADGERIMRLYTFMMLFLS